MNGFEKLFNLLDRTAYAALHAKSLTMEEVANFSWYFKAIRQHPCLTAHCESLGFPDVVGLAPQVYLTTLLRVRAGCRQSVSARSRLRRSMPLIELLSTVPVRRPVGETESGAHGVAHPKANNAASAMRSRRHGPVTTHKRRPLPRKGYLLRVSGKRFPPP